MQNCLKNWNLDLKEQSTGININQKFQTEEKTKV